MAFKSKAELNGERDPNIWTQGSRNPEKGNQSRRSQVQSELSSLIRRFRPVQSQAIAAAVKIIGNEESADANKLRASALIISTYQSLLRDLNNLGEDEGTETVDELIKAPRFSLHVIKPEDKEQ